MHDLIPPPAPALEHRSFRATLLGSVAICAMVGASGVLADGGDAGFISSGGESHFSGTGETGGTVVRGLNGGGGGGAGVTGGNGGSPTGCEDSDCGTSSGTAAGGSGGQPGVRDGLGGDGGNGQDATWRGGGGGGGGAAHGFNDVSGPIADREFSGGRGGKGGNGTTGGGGGGFGLVLQNSTDYSITQRAVGGAGGDGGHGGEGQGGGGGDGGIGIAATNADSLAVRAVMMGGKGGRGGGNDRLDGLGLGKGGRGGAGVYSTSRSTSIEAMVIGGDGGDSNNGQGGTGGSGVEASGDVTVSAEIRGGNSGVGSNGAYTGLGGTGIELKGTSHANTFAPIRGGEGITGGTGIFLRTDTDVTVNSSVRGGNGSTSGGTAIDGEGTGHEITLQANAVVSGGLAGSVRGAAIRVTGDSTLNLSAGAVIEGDIVIDYGNCPSGSCYMSALTVNAPSDFSYNGAFRGIGTLEKQGSGTLTLSGANAYGGRIVIGQGTLALTGVSNLASAASLRLDGTLDISGLSAFSTTVPGLARTALGEPAPGNIVLGDKTLIINQGSIGDFAGRIIGAGSFIKDGGGALTLYAEQGYSGATIIRGGGLRLTGYGSIANSSAVQIDSMLGTSGSGDLVFRNLSGSETGRLYLGNSGSLTIDQDADGTFAGSLENYAAVRKTGAGTLTLTGNSTRFDHIYSPFIGTIAIEEGTLALAGNANIGRSRGMSVDGVLDISGLTAAGTTLSNLAGNGTVALGGKSLTLNQTADSTFSGEFNGAGSFRKTGTGRLVLSGASTHTGGTTVGQGVLELSGSLGGPVAIGPNGVLFAAGGTVEGAVTVESGGALFGGQNGGTLRMGGLSLAAGSTTNVSLDAPSGAALFDVAGPLTINGTLNVTGGGGYGTGIYRIFSTSDTVTDAGLALGSAPTIENVVTRLDIGERTVDVLVTGDGSALQYWSGNGADRGGSGTWSGATRWLEPDGRQRSWLNGTGVFDGPAGRITVEGAQRIGTLEFLTSGYELVAGSGGELLLDGGGRLWAEGAQTTATVSAPLTGAGSLTKIGAGTIVLAGANSYSGGTLLQAGTLTLASNNALGTGRLDARDGTRLSFGADQLNVANAMALSGNIDIATGSDQAATLSGVIGDGLMPGSVVKTGAGKLTLTGDNGYTGHTVISAGTLQIGDGGTSGSILGDVANNGTLVFNRRDDVTFGGAVLGAGALVKQGAGRLTLTGDNNYTGGTTIAQGTLIGNSSSLSGNITNNSSLIFDQGHTGTYSGSISGSGALTKQGSGTLILTGNNSHAGGTVIEEGTLQIGDGGRSGSISGSIVNNGALVLNRSGTYDVNASITGTGSLAIVGGTVNFTGTSYAGPVSVEASTFNLAPHSRWGSIFTIEQGGTIGGSGTIGGLIVRQGGTVSPGYSPGTLNVAGNVAFDAGSNYTVDVTADGAHDLIAATGAATLSGGTVNVRAVRGLYGARSTHTILSAQGGITGRFASASSDLAFLTPSLSYDPHNAYLTLTRNQVDFSALAGSPNARAAAAATEMLGFGNDLYEALVLLSADQAGTAFDSLSGEAHATAAGVALGDAERVRNGLLTRLRQPLAARPAQPDAPAPGRFALWGEGFGSWGRAGANGNAAGLDTATGGFILGADAPVADAVRLGLAGGLIRTGFDIDGRLASGRTESVFGALYGSGAWGGVTLRLGAASAGHALEVNRAIRFPGFRDQTGASYDGWSAQAFGEAGYRIDLGPVQLEPFAGAAVLRLHTDGFAEDGGAAALTGSARVHALATTTLGVRAEARLSDTVPLVARGLLGWRHAYGDVEPAALLAFGGGASVFSVAGTPVDRDALVAEAGLDWQASDAISLGVAYAGQIGAQAQEHAVKGNLTWRF
ncbi:autotransporter-associated beta strand repeat-containing protein [Microvirga mediterraneensis]|uniref:Autotransporter-associated beta strand repeat-containing protein n=1 Tax=Microvirga mediterraneensis TaxID=2754695 RepID=A0A838BU22_9HYPH|nr:autotransporter-associated beta strand repeat-containing protein [Microvirga mediterraneensis]MBA1158559.1 autotransporter-associated beta strand repeat-containing protein [Microvirga mediterraneensis]